MLSVERHNTGRSLACQRTILPRTSRVLLIDLLSITVVEVTTKTLVFWPQLTASVRLSLCKPCVKGGLLRTDGLLYDVSGTELDDVSRGEDRIRSQMLSALPTSIS